MRYQGVRVVATGLALVHFVGQNWSAMRVAGWVDNRLRGVASKLVRAIGRRFGPW
jgi:hypothetical protein